MRQITFILALVFSFSLSAQEHPASWCGTFPTHEAHEALDVRLVQNLETVSNSPIQFRSILYVPVKFHLAGRNDGSGRVSESNVLDQLCELNEDFAPHEIQFFLADGTFNYINNTSLYENHFAVQNSVMQQQKDSRALNIWIVETVDDGEGEGVTLAYYHTQRDWIVIRKANIKGNDNTLSHEVGHFFSLDHTFYGWESEGYLTENVPAPSVSSGGILTELMDGSNCTIAADRICDTPPDYGFGFGWSNCNFTLNILDPNGELVVTDESNMLSYFLNCSDEEYHFSDQQVAVMRADYNSNFHSYLSIDPVPDYVEINTLPNLISPAPGVTIDCYNHAELEWSAVAGATHYLVELSRTSSMNVNPIRVVVSGPNAVIETLEEDKKYYWRITPFNAHVACSSASIVESFESGTCFVATKDIPSNIDAFTVSPNPVSVNQELTVFIKLSEATTANVRLVDMTGRLVQQSNTQEFNVGDNRLSVSTSELTSGLYFLQLNTAEGQVTKKVVVAK